MHWWVANHTDQPRYARGLNPPLLCKSKKNQVAPQNQYNLLEKRHIILLLGIEVLSATTSTWLTGVWCMIHYLARRSTKIDCRDGLCLYGCLSCCLLLGTSEVLDRFSAKILYKHYDVLCHSKFARYWQSVLEKWRAQEIVRNTPVQVSTD
jgi:hypothetical protein